jgi:hypothetical protein
MPCLKEQKIMLLQPYQVLKTRLIPIEGIKLMTWFNDQIASGKLHAEPAILIGFPEPLQPETLNRQYQQSNLITRIYLIHKLILEADGSVNESIMQTHENIARSIYDLLHEFSYDENDFIVLNSMERTDYQLDMNNPGWAITIQDFHCLMYQSPESQVYHSAEKPDPDIEAYNSRQEFIKVNWPNGGEGLTAEGTYLITWDMFIKEGDVRIELLLKDDPPIIITNHASGGSYQWNISRVIAPDNNYRIRIVSNENGNILDESDGVFTINPLKK